MATGILSMVPLLLVTSFLLQQSSVSAKTIEIQWALDASEAPYSPKIAVGDTVKWILADILSHTVTSTTGAFDSGTLAPGSTFSHTFDKAGTYPYRCLVHAYLMGGTITVETADAPKTVNIKWQLTSTTGYFPTIYVGDTVQWRVADSLNHTVSSNDFDSGVLAPGSSFRHTFKKAGLFPYFCKLHSYGTMRGTVTVKQRGLKSPPKKKTPPPGGNKKPPSSPPKKKSPPAVKRGQ